MNMKKNQIFKKKWKNEAKNGKFEGITFALVFHQWFNNINIFCHMWEKTSFQI
jgi:hypothetical protein